MDILDDYMRNLENAGILKGWSEFMDKRKEKAQDKGRILNDFTFYWPIAKTKEGHSRFTYDSVPTIRDCFKQFDIWDNDVDKIEEAYIQKITGDKREVIPCKKMWVMDGKYTETKTAEPVIAHWIPATLDKGFVVCDRCREIQDEESGCRAWRRDFAATLKFCPECGAKIESEAGT